MIGLVPCAKGVSKIKHWALGTKYYERLVDGAKRPRLQRGEKLQVILRVS